MNTARAALVIRWIERAPDFYEARLTTPDGGVVYLGYIAVTPGAAVWRGYGGRGFEPVGLGPRATMEEAVERRTVEALVDSEAGQATERMRG